MTLEERAELRGERRGEQKRNMEIAKLMLDEKQPLEYIMKLSNLTMEQIQALGNQDGNLGST